MNTSPQQFHKSQGSTYENVILMEEDVIRNKKITERNRLLYTAYTRASNRVYTLKPPENL